MSNIRLMRAVKKENKSFEAVQPLNITFVLFYCLLFIYTRNQALHLCICSAFKNIYLLLSLRLNVIEIFILLLVICIKIRLLTNQSVL